MQGAGHKLVAQCAHALQHGGDVGGEALGAAQAKCFKSMAAVKGVGRFNQRFGWHAAHACAGGAPGAFVDDEIALGALAHLAQRGQACRACADDEGVERLAHAVSPRGHESCSVRAQRPLGV